MIGKFSLTIESQFGYKNSRTPSDEIKGRVMASSIASAAAFDRSAASTAVGSGGHELAAWLATAALIFFAPLIGLINFAVVVGSPGPAVVAVPYRRRDGRLVFLTEFRTRRAFDTETYDAVSASPQGWSTSVGSALRFLGLARLPVLFDVRAGRVGLVEGLLR